MSTYEIISDPIVLVISIGFLGLYVWILRRPFRTDRGFRTAGLLRRFWAFVIDYFLAALIVMPWTTLISLLIEAVRTGYFSWIVQRESLPGDGWLMFMLFILDVVGMLTYFALPQRYMRATPGSTFLGITVLYDSGKPPSLLVAFTRSVLGYIALCLFPLSVPLALSNTDKQMWQDIRCGTRVVQWIG